MLDWKRFVQTGRLSNLSQSKAIEWQVTTAAVACRAGCRMKTFTSSTRNGFHIAKLKGCAFVSEMTSNFPNLHRPLSHKLGQAVPAALLLSRCVSFENVIDATFRCQTTSLCLQRHSCTNHYASVTAEIILLTSHEWHDAVKIVSFLISVALHTSFFFIPILRVSGLNFLLQRWTAYLVILNVTYYRAPFFAVLIRKVL